MISVHSIQEIHKKFKNVLDLDKEKFLSLYPTHSPQDLQVFYDFISSDKSLWRKFIKKVNKLTFVYLLGFLFIFPNKYEFFSKSTSVLFHTSDPLRDVPLYNFFKILKICKDQKDLFYSVLGEEFKLHFTLCSDKDVYKDSSKDV